MTTIFLTNFHEEIFDFVKDHEELYDKTNELFKNKQARIACGKALSRHANSPGL